MMQTAASHTRVCITAVYLSSTPDGFQEEPPPRVRPKLRCLSATWWNCSACRALGLVPRGLTQALRGVQGACAEAPLTCITGPCAVAHWAMVELRAPLWPLWALWGGVAARGQWAMKTQQYTAALQWAVGSENPSLHCHAFLQGVVGIGSALGHCHTARGSGQWDSYNALPHYMGQWVVQLLHFTTSLQGARGSWSAPMHCIAVGSSGECKSFNTLPPTL